MGNPLFGLPSLDMVGQAARMSADSAVNDYMVRFGHRFGDNEKQKMVHEVAMAAAEAALERFRAICHNELRMIGIDHEQRYRDAMLRGPAPMIVTKDD